MAAPVEAMLIAPLLLLEVMPAPMPTKNGVTDEPIEPALVIAMFDAAPAEPVTKAWMPWPELPTVALMPPAADLAMVMLPVPVVSALMPL